MTDLLTPGQEPADPAAGPPRRVRATPDRPRAGLFRAVWRWHFFASFLVIPVVALLSVTGLIYLFRFEVEPLLHPDLMQVEAPTGNAVAQPYLTQQAKVVQEFPDATLVSMAEPREEGRPTVFSIVTPEEESLDVYVSPYGPEVLGSLDPENTLSGIAVRLHGELMAGRWGDLVLELGACWAVVMALTGYYLFWRGRAARRRQRAGGVPRARLRSRHALVGSFVGLGLLTLLVSGLPWTGVWGERVQALATANGTSLWSEDHGAISDPTSPLDESLPHSHRTDVPWAMGDSQVPRSEPPYGTTDPGTERSVANIDTAVEVADRTGLRHPMTVALPDPADPGGVYSVIGYAFDAPSDEQTVHVDQYGGDVVDTYGFDDYPVLAQVVAQGIGLHEGRSLGLVSFWGAALLCLGVLFMCVTGPLMWWRRRPAAGRSIGAPRGRMPLRSPALLVGLVVLGVLLPVFGASLLLVLVLDQVVLRRVPALAHWFDRT